MTTAETSTLVFKDQAGEYYLVPWETLEQGRVPAEQKAEVERLIAESHDVAGHAASLTGVFAGVFAGVTRGVGEALGTNAPHQSQQGGG